MDKIYSHLRKYGLVTPNKVAKRLEKFTETKVDNFINEYLANAAQVGILKEPILGATDIYPDSFANEYAMQTIRQLSIYANRIYIHDPLVMWAREWENRHNQPSLLMTLREPIQRVNFFKELLAEEVESILAIWPLVKAGIIHLSPSELVQYYPNPLLIHADTLFGPDGPLSSEESETREFPPKLQAFCDEYLIVQSATFANSEMEVLPNIPLTPRNKIAIKIKDIPRNWFFQVGEIEGPDDESEESGKFVFVYPLADKEIDANTFEHWVAASKMKVLNQRIDRLSKDVYLASLAGAKFVTPYKSSKELVLANLNTETDLKDTNSVISALLSVNLPFFEQASLENIVKARENEIAFEEFRRALNAAFKEVNSLDDSRNFQAQAEEVFADILLHQTKMVEKKMKELKKGLFIDAMLITGALTAAVALQGNTILTQAAMAAITTAGLMYHRHQPKASSIKELPSFFYWQTTHGK